MAKVFVSYSRKDIEFAKRLTAELQKSELDFWIDWEGIPPTVDWWKEIEKGIEEADVFLFLISPDSARSKVCGQEIDVAVKNGKRLIPIVVREIAWEDTPPHLGHLNYIFFREDDNFDIAVQKLLSAIHTDFEWAQTHRRLQVRALEWERNNKEPSFLLRGKDLQDAEFQLATNTSKEPYPTDLQREYVFTSRRISSRQRRIVTAISIAGIIGLIAIAIYGYVQTRLRALQKTAQNEGPMATIPAGSATMESDQAQTVELPEFKIELNPVSNLAYYACVNANTSKCTPPTGSSDFVPDRNPNDPVVFVTIAQAAIYCNWIGRSLPSAAQWDSAATFLPQWTSSLEHLSNSHQEWYEWTSSYLTDDDKTGINHIWDTSLDPATRFRVRGGYFDPQGVIELKTDLMHLSVLYSADNLGFRCVSN